MRERLVSVLKKELDLALVGTTPSFTRVTNEDVAPQCLLYAAEFPDLRAYLMFQAHRKEDSFTAEVAASKGRHWPAMFLRIPTNLEELSPGGEIRFRMARFWGQGDHWWPVASEPAVKAAVADVMNQIKHYVVPYFSKLSGRPGN